MSSSAKMSRLCNFCGLCPCGREADVVCKIPSVSIPDPPAATTKEEKKIPWWRRLFGWSHADASDGETTKLDEPKKRAKKAWWWSKSRRQVSPVAEEQGPKEDSHSTPHEDEVVEFKLEEEECHPTPHEDEVVEFKLEEEECHPTPQHDKVVVREKKALLESASQKAKVDVFSTLRLKQVKFLGFPNPAQFCYMNSCLQSLLTLKDFVRDISGQEHVWSSTPEAALMRSFMDIMRSHFSRDTSHKFCLLTTFKKAVSSWDPEFKDQDQKDAHEFLTSVLNHMRSLRPQLQLRAASMDRVYNCPVEDHMVFRMQSTRTCKSCGAGSTREEEYTNLSLDLLPGGGTVEDLLEDYLKETEVEYRCGCGDATSSQRMAFVNLPKVLVLHLKRFRYTPTFQLRKVHDPVTLFRDLVVSSNQGGGCYSLVSSINHISPFAVSGHYICDGVDPDVGQEDPTDRWFTYNDTVVTETSGDTVCNKRERESYILFYKRMG